MTEVHRIKLFMRFIIKGLNMGEYFPNIMILLSECSLDFTIIAWKSLFVALLWSIKSLPKQTFGLLRILTKLLLSSSVASTLILALTFLHLVNSMLESMPQCHSAQIYSVMNLLQIHLKTYYVRSIYLSNVFVFYIPKLGVLIASNWLPNQN